MALVAASAVYSFLASISCNRGPTLTGSRGCANKIVQDKATFFFFFSKKKQGDSQAFGVLLAATSIKLAKVSDEG